MLWSIDSRQKRASADQCHMSVSRAQVYNSLSLPLVDFQLIAGSGLFFSEGIQLTFYGKG